MDVIIVDGYNVINASKKLMRLDLAHARDELFDMLRNYSGFTASKILWVRENEPELYARCRKILLPKDYLRWRLGVAEAKLSGMRVATVPEAEALAQAQADVDFYQRKLEA